ncbi:MAG: amidohydrolase family protein [Patescibacteria group bacterium]
MLIDVHTHIGPQEPMMKTAAELVAAMDVAKIDLSLAFACPINGCDNEWLKGQIAVFPGRLKGVATISPIHDRPEKLLPLRRSFESGDFVALKFYLGYEHFYPDDPRLTDWYRMMSDIGKPVIFHCGDLYSEAKGALLKYSHPLVIDDVAGMFPDLKIVIAHMGNPWIKEAALVCTKNANVYADVSGYVDGAFTERRLQAFQRVLTEFEDIADAQRHSKLLFGTDWPICDSADYAKRLQSVFGPGSEAVFADTAKRVFGLT